MIKLLFAAALLAMSLSAADRKVITPANGVPPVGPYSPGLLAGDYLYVSGQGAAKPDGSFPSTAEEQTAQCLTNVSRIVDAAGLTMEHVVYAHVYMKDLAGLDGMNRAWRKAFPADPPARVVVGVEKMPVDTPVEVTIVAVRDLGTKRAIQPSGLESRGVLTADRLYISSSPALDTMAGVLKAAGLDLHHLAFVNTYRTHAGREAANLSGAATATVNIAALPGGAATAFTGVAARDLAKRRSAGRCASIGEALFCSAQSGGATTEAQVRETMRTLLDGLKAATMTFDNVVATNVYLDDIGEFARMNKVYGEHFGKTPPTRTTIQPFPSAGGGAARLRISLIAVK